MIKVGVSKIIDNIFDQKEVTYDVLIQGKNRKVTKLVFPNIEKLKNIASKNPLILQKALVKEDDKKKRLAICEILHSLNDHKLTNLFITILEDENELCECAIIGLAKLQDKRALTYVDKLIARHNCYSKQFFGALCLLHFSEKKAIDVFVSILEQEYNNSKTNITEFTSTITLILSYVFSRDDFPDSTFWIKWWQKKRFSNLPLDVLNVPDYLMNYSIAYNHNT